MNDGWIKIYRQLLTWEWFDNSKMVHIFLYFLLQANTEEKVWRGLSIHRGQFATSVPTISAATGLSEQEIRTCVKRLVKAKQIEYDSTKRATHRCVLITICNYEKYQAVKPKDNGQPNEPTTEDPQTSNEPATDDPREHKNNKNNRIKEYFVVESCAREEFLEKFFAPERLVSLEALCMNLHTDMETLKKTAGEVLVEWEATEQPLHQDLNAAYKHLVSQIRIKFSRVRSGVPQNTLFHFSTTQCDNGTTTNPELYIDPYTARQREFAEHILRELNTPDEPEPDLSILY